MNTQDGLSFGEWLRDELDRRRMRQGDLADAVGVDQGTVSNWANDQSRPQPVHCDSIAEAFGIERNEVRVRAGRKPAVQALKPERPFMPGGLTPEEIDVMRRIVERFDRETRD